MGANARRGRDAAEIRLKIIGIVGASALRARSLIDKLIASLRFDGWSVSTIKRAPDGFDLDQPGKTSYERREAGCREVMLVGDRRLALMSEFRDEPEPPLTDLASRLLPVDIVIAEGFKDASVPTVEVFVRARHAEPRCDRDSNIVAVISDERIECRVPRFDPDDIDGLCTFLVRHLGLESPQSRHSS
jgi:molybdopterin-guanine dinucleotide biosynthesis adapter protein